eukprot:CAMPEP_0185022866 /NCGR_PEP_ID=MMETSP1103-20130426/5566_1 /TAXON_ID=36769 /ORGANISM="Paraphysomonas bandaiensis, Strain Caron Lab Isolate" /LENGTH=649 /DNA_ID=CAMNT_0027555137 /DNA_START=113 /DNA_END=2062 /DNA_ORIENTATION=-
MSTLNFDAMATCKADNWGMPLQSKKPKAESSYYDEHIRKPCAAQWKENEKPMSELLKMATVIHSKDTPSYDDFESTDWVPENKGFYAKASPWGNEGKYNFRSTPKKSMKASECHLYNEDGSTWAVTRVGPMHTNGGYDWLQLGWDDLFGFSAVLKDHPDGIYIVEQYMSPVLEDGTRLSNPPIHVHHMHSGPDPYVRQRMDPMTCAIRGLNCFNPLRTLETHGDYVCVAEDGGNDCHVESFHEGYGKLITHTLGLEGEINDVRPHHSETLVWYWEIGARWVPKATTGPGASLKAMSLHNMAGPGTYDPKVQRSFLFTFPTPSDRQSMFWYTGRLQNHGKMLRMKIHAHNTIFREAIIFAASPEQLGMTELNGFPMDKPHLPVDVVAAGFESNEALKRFLLLNLQRSQERYDALPSDQHRTNEKTCGYPNEACVVSRPKAICQSFAHLEIIDGFAFDRRQPTCCDPWEWPSGQVFTVVGFSEHQGYPLGPHAPDMKDIPPTLPGHVGYWLTYDSEETPEHSRWGYSLYNHDPNGGLNSVADMTGYQKIAMYINGYTSPHFNDWTKTPHSVVSILAYGALSHLAVTIIIVSILLVYTGYHTYHLSMKLLKDAPHKKSDDFFCQKIVPTSSFFYSPVRQDDIELAGRGSGND